MQINVERESVCAGDDVDSPHARSFVMQPDDAGDLTSAAIEFVIDAHYLASVEGGSTWIAYSSGVALAVVALGPDDEVRQVLRTSAQLVPKNGSVALRFQYFTANSPVRLLDELNAGREPEKRWQERW